jgi:hypothetical protein
MNYEQNIKVLQESDYTIFHSEQFSSFTLFIILCLPVFKNGKFEHSVSEVVCSFIHRSAFVETHTQLVLIGSLSH